MIDTTRFDKLFVIFKRERKNKCKICGARIVGTTCEKGCWYIED